jgi:hypothetical protein
MLKVVIFVGILLVAGIAAYASMTAISVVKKRLEEEPRFPGPELDAIRARLEATDALGARVAELEERLDFAERLLARHHEPERLPSGRTLDAPR